MCTCPHCNLRIEPENNESLPATCPHCGADLYAEEIDFLNQLAAEPAGAGA